MGKGATFEPVQEGTIREVPLYSKPYMAYMSG